MKTLPEHDPVDARALIQVWNFEWAALDDDDRCIAAAPEVTAELFKRVPTAKEKLRDAGEVVAAVLADLYAARAGLYERYGGSPGHLECRYYLRCDIPGGDDCACAHPDQEAAQ